MEFTTLGQVVMTRGIAQHVDKGLGAFIQSCLERYKKCDWGDMEKDDIEMNNRAIKVDDRVLVAYNLPDNLKEITGEDKIWIITEWNRSVTTILYPSEY